ncbi:acyl carrier protein [Paenibacillus sp. SYP-B4298]|uniref:acyl carrier protein n=1 Tax=Paenibacillus sp. SYP-B4298 TaxID=2996034 RepID=UPI0022DE098B|nr:acyl carrier protein [Paenibacillus sp. SYP-B4298]
MTNHKDELTQRVMEIIGEMTDQQLDEQALDRPFHELGVDSLMALELAVYIEREYKVRLDESELAEIASMRQLLHIIKTKSMKS